MFEIWIKWDYTKNQFNYYLIYPNEHLSYDFTKSAVFHRSYKTKEQAEEQLIYIKSRSNGIIHD